MSAVSHTKSIELPIDKIWAVLDDFKNIYKWHYNAHSSSLLSSNNEGLGATRKVCMNNGNEVVEKIMEYKKGEYMKAEVIEHNMPLRKAFLTFNLKKQTENSTEVTVEIDFQMKFGPLGWLMDKLMMSPSVRKTNRLVLNGLEQYIVTGKEIGKDGNPID